MIGLARCVNNNMYLRRISIGVHYSAGDFPVTVDFTRFAPGSHSLLLNVTSIRREVAIQEVRFNVPAPLGKYTYMVYMSVLTDSQLDVNFSIIIIILGRSKLVDLKLYYRFCHVSVTNYIVL